MNRFKERNRDGKNSDTLREGEKIKEIEENVEKKKTKLNDLKTEEGYKFKPHKNRIKNM